MVFALASRGAAAPGPQAIRRRLQGIAELVFALASRARKCTGLDSTHKVARFCGGRSEAGWLAVAVNWLIAPEPVHSPARHAKRQVAGQWGGQLRNSARPAAELRSCGCSVGRRFGRWLFFHRPAPALPPHPATAARRGDAAEEEGAGFGNRRQGGSNCLVDVVGQGHTG